MFTKLDPLVHLSSPWWASEYLPIGGTTRSIKFIFNSYKNMVEATPKGSKIKKDRKLIIDFYDVIHCAKY
jgi:hypothetical protein